VLRPSVVDVPNEKISILEAIGMAGDMTVYARRENVLLIREEDGKKIIRRLNLNSQEIFSSQYFYLKTNDVIYVESNRAKVQNSSRFTALLPTLLSALALLVVLFQYTKI
jgi:polysaccharide export outer membrane protein